MVTMPKHILLEMCNSKNGIVSTAKYGSIEWQVREPTHYRVVLLIFGVCFLLSGIQGFYNPEYYAIAKIIELLRGQ